jgi:hypothetical protein
MSNVDQLKALWSKVGEPIDEQRLRLFSQMTDREQQSIIDQIKQELGLGVKLTNDKPLVNLPG